MSEAARKHFKDMLELVTPYIKEERGSLYFEGTQNDDGWDVIVSYIASRNGAKLFVPEIAALKAPFEALVEIYKDGGKGEASKCMLSLSPQGEVSLKMEYTDAVAM